MSDEHSARAGSLNAHLTSVKMEIDDDDEDITDSGRDENQRKADNWPAMAIVDI